MDADAHAYPYQVKAQSAAIPPDDLDVIMRNSIEESIDSMLWDEALGRESAERNKVLEVTKQWGAT